MKDGIRLFVAATLPQEMKAFLQEQAQNFIHPSIRPVPEQNLHLTLFFIGDTPVSNLETIKESLKKISSEQLSFTLQYMCTEPGPNPRSPRLIWARFAQHPQFENLSKTLAGSLAPDQNMKQKPIPHITLARYKKNVPAPTVTSLQQPESDMSLVVDSISLWQSALASPHPIYTVLETYSFAH